MSLAQIQPPVNQALLIAKGWSQENGGVATLFDGTQITEVPLDEAELRLGMEELATSRGWGKPSEDDKLFYRRVRQEQGKEPTIIYGPGVREQIADFTKNLRDQERE